MRFKIFLLILLIALVPRIIELFSTSNYFGSEQAENYLLTKKIVVDHQIILTARQGGFGGFLKPAGFNYFLIMPFIIASGNPFGGRVFMFFISVLTVVVAFILSNRMFNLTTAFFVSFLLAISPNLSNFAGRIWPPFVIPIFSVIVLFSLYKGLEGNKKFVLLMAFIIGLTSHFEMATTGKLSLLFFIGLFFFLMRKKISYLLFFFSIALFVIPLSPLFISDWIYGTQNLIGIIKLMGHGTNHVIDIGNRLEVFSWNLLSTFSPHILIWPGILLTMNVGTLIYLKTHKNNSAQKYLVLSLWLIPIIYFIILLFYPENIFGWWLIELTVFYCFLLGIVLGFFWEKFYYRLLVILILAVLFISFVRKTYNLYKNDFAFPKTIDMYVKESSPIKYIFEDAGKKPFTIVVYSSNPPENYDYLIWWYQTNIYKYSQNKQKSKLSYALFERDYYRFLGDKKVNLLFGKSNVLSTKIFPSGFIVKKIIDKGTE